LFNFGKSDWSFRGRGQARERSREDKWWEDGDWGLHHTRKVLEELIFGGCRGRNAA
jgi:hypothetical protein